MKTLVLEPLHPTGIAIRIIDRDRVLAEKIIDRGEDSVAALAGLKKQCARIERIVVRSKVGSFSASRSALVIAQILGAVQDCPILYTEEPVATPAELAAISISKEHVFEYERPPNISTPRT